MKKSNEIQSNSANKRLTEITETQMYLEKEILTLLEQVFHEKI